MYKNKVIGPIEMQLMPPPTSPPISSVRKNKSTRIYIESNRAIIVLSSPVQSYMGLNIDSRV